MSHSNALRRALRLACAAAVAALLGLGVGVSDAQASHYELADIDLVEAEAVQKLAAIGVEDTKALLERLVTAEGRQDTAVAMGVEVDKVTDLARHLELMQIVGIGPRAARLLVAAGVGSVKDLAGADAGELLARLVATNAEKQLTGVDPDNEVVVDWISKAGTVAFTLQ